MGIFMGIYYDSLTTKTLIRPDLPISTMLLNKILGAQGHHMFTDYYTSYIIYYYTSYILVNELYNLKYHLIGNIEK